MRVRDLNLDNSELLAVVMAEGLVCWARRHCQPDPKRPADAIAGRILLDRIQRRLVEREKMTELFSALSRNPRSVYYELPVSKGAVNL